MNVRHFSAKLYFQMNLWTNACTKAMLIVQKSDLNTLLKDIKN